MTRTLLEQTGLGLTKLALQPASGQVANSGANTLLTPAPGRRLRVFYAAYNPLNDVMAYFRFGAAGSAWLRNDILAHAVIAKDFGDFRYLEGADDEALVLVLSAAVVTNWNCFYLEV